ncbi:MAG TPA: hypothetical protein IGS17_14360 [Oscillatoriales cyanobacterium M59_W2019_021]|nr:hypothetical protein [Oscillatoriales cyanobacterium M4454_W2019_049]HIK52086.1 hypothetical protein [Oscillatoriales cyanobacterium M59_W2019_021]
MNLNRQHNVPKKFVRGDPDSSERSPAAGTSQLTGNLARIPRDLSPSLIEAAQEIQGLMVRLSQNYATDTKVAIEGFVNEIIRLINEDSALSQNLLQVSKTEDISAIKYRLNHPLSHLAIVALERWRNEKQS